MNKVSDYDIVYISYDEPNAQENYEDLLTKFPSAKRVHGVKGFDAAHRKAASIVDTDHFFIVDGDNKVTQDFADLELENLNENYVYSWASKNIVNGLIYGNGGIKLWPKHFWENLECHDNGKGTDWCYDVPYFQMNDWFSYSFCNASPFQAFRTGFREGIKLCLDGEGKKSPNLKKNINLIFESNLKRLITWLSVGADISNGMYAIYGARLGTLKVICENDFDVNCISDYEWIENYWNGELSFVKDGHYMDHYNEMAKDLRKITGLSISNFDPVQSKCVKEMILNPKRIGLMKPELGSKEYLMANSFLKKNLK